MKHDENEILDWQEAAEFIGVSARTLARWYAEGIGPPRVKVGRQVLYLKASLLVWLSDMEKKPCRT